jgi:hypothetical protein
MAATALYEKLKKDPNAIRVILVEITGKKPDGTLVTARLGDEGWNTDADESPANVHFYRCLLQGLNLSSSILQAGEGGGLEGGVGIPSYGSIEAFNRDGLWDEWADYSVDGLTVRALMVGWLCDGTRVRYTDAASEPILTGVGVDRPSVGDTFRVAIRSRLGLLEQDAQPLTYAPPCPVFPGSSSHHVDFGDVLDLPAGSWTIEGWFYTEDPNQTLQFLVSKDFNLGGNGWGVELGTGGAGTIRGYCREQTNNTTTSATSLVKPRRWTHFAVRYDSAASTRTLLLDGTAVVTTAGVTGNAANNSAPFRLGWGLNGRVSWVRLWSTARSDATIRAEMYLPQLPSATGLFEDIPADEGRPGLPIRGRKTGSTTSGTASSGVTWGSGAWIGASLAGKHRRTVLGRALEVELVPRDPAKKVYEAGILGTVQSVTPVSSNGNNLAGGTYTVDAARGLVTVAAGTDVGRMTADVTGVVPWGYAGSFDGVDDVAAPALSVICPAGSMAVAALASTPTYATKARVLAGWRNGGGAGFRTLYFGAVSVNGLLWEVRNDAGTSFSVSYGPVPENILFFAEGVLDVAAAKIRLYFQGLEVATASVSGTFNTVSNTFAVGRLSDLSLFYHDGLIDAVYILNRVPTASEAALMALRELASSSEATSFGLQDGWLFNEGTGTTVANLVTGRPALNLTGATFTASRHAHVDLILYLLSRIGITTADLSVAKAVAFLRDVPGQAFLVMEDDSDLLSHVNALLRGVRSALVESGSTFILDLLRLPEGASALTFTERHCTDQPIEPESLGRTIWGMDILFGRCHTPFDAEDIASTIAANDPERFRFLTAEDGWQFYPKRDGSVLSDYPGAEIAVVPSHLLYQRDAQNLGNLLLPIHGPRQFALNVQVDTENPTLAILGEFNFLVTELDGKQRFGGASAYRIISIRREETIYTFVIWRKRT